jgi:hypothetical protein
MADGKTTRGRGSVRGRAGANLIPKYPARAMESFGIGFTQVHPLDVAEKTAVKIDQKPNPETCPRCGRPAVSLRWQRFRDGSAMESRPERG